MYSINVSYYNCNYYATHPSHKHIQVCPTAWIFVTFSSPFLCIKFQTGIKEIGLYWYPPGFQVPALEIYIKNTKSEEESWPQSPEKARLKQEYTHWPSLPVPLCRTGWLVSQLRARNMFASGLYQEKPSYPPGNKAHSFLGSAAHNPAHLKGTCLKEHSLLPKCPEIHKNVVFSGTGLISLLCRGERDEIDG